MDVAMLNAPCDRCAKVAGELRPFTLQATITYRGRVIDLPWLCLKCFVAEKKKWWALKQFPKEAT